MAMSYREVVRRICRSTAWRWSKRWWSDGELIVMTSTDRVWCVPWRKIDDHFPSQVVALGCGGWDHLDQLRWVGWDLDVGQHGGKKSGVRQSYETAEDAAIAGRGLVAALVAAGAAPVDVELRRSKSGSGCHVRWLVVSMGLKKEQGPKIAKHWASQLQLLADPTPLGRQAHWLWVRTPAVGAFEDIHE
jgi:hypothetical protein